MGGRRFLRIQTVVSRETRFFRTVWGVILGLMRLNYLSVRVWIERMVGDVRLGKEVRGAIEVRRAG